MGRNDLFFIESIKKMVIPPFYYPLGQVMEIIVVLITMEQMLKDIQTYMY